MSFAQPWWLAAGVVLAALFLIAAHLASRRGSAAAMAYSELAFVERAARVRFDAALPLALAAALALLLGAAALADPRMLASVPVRGAVVLCVDTSGSMRATDVAPTRADAAAAAVRAFVDGVPAGTRLGIVAFASGAGVVQPLSDDKDAVREGIARIPPPNGGTAIGDALAAAARVLPASGKRTIVLVTDGVTNLGVDPLGVARELGAAGVEIDTVGIGTNGSGELIPGTAQEASIDEDALRAIASSARGAYARADDAGSLRSRLAALAASTTREKKPVHLAFPLAIAAVALVAAALGTGLIAGRFP